MFYGYYGWAPYISVSEKISRAKKKMKKLARTGLDVQPIEAFRGPITKTFWGKEWCRHIESFQEVTNRLQRGQTYVHNGSVCHLAIEPGKVTAYVAGSEPYKVNIDVKKLSVSRWNLLKRGVVGQIDSLFDLLQGKISNDVLTQLADAKNGLFPQLKELKFTCSCPDGFYTKNWMCKHIAAVFYGIGRRFETKPELLFTLRGVNSQDLVISGAKAQVERQIDEAASPLGKDELENIFDIELAPTNGKKDRKIGKPVKTPVKKSPANTVEKTTPEKRTPDKTTPKKTTPQTTVLKTIAILSMKITVKDRMKINKAAAKVGLTQNAFIIARLKEERQSNPDEVAAPNKLKRTKQNAIKDSQLLVRLSPSEKKKVQRCAKKSGLTMSEYVYNILFE